MNASEICLKLIWQTKCDKYEYLNIIFGFLNILLEPNQIKDKSILGNQKVQETIYLYFKNNSESENFFKKINHLL